MSRQDVTKKEQRKSLQQQDIGRIVIEEIPEEKDESKRVTHQATRHEVVPRECLKEEVIKVRQSDVSPIRTRTQRFDKVDGRQEVMILNFLF